MQNSWPIPFVENGGIARTVLATAGFAAIVVGIYQGVLHVAPGYQGTIGAGVAVPGSREWLLAGVGAAGIVGAAASLGRKRLSVVPLAAGGVVLFEAFRTVVLAANTLPYPLYTETAYRSSGEPVVFVFGAQPFLLVAGGVLLVVAGIVGLRGRGARENGDEPSSPPTTTA